MALDEYRAIDVSHVSKSFSAGFPSGARTRALRDVTFHVRKGEIFGLIGPNGAGKTTLLKSILRLVFIDDGTIAVNGTDQSAQDWKSSVGYLPEDFRTDDNATPLDILRLMAHLHAMDSRIIQERISDVCDILDLHDFLWKKMRTFSTGMIRRVGLAQAILHRPSILLLDEPANGLDPLGQHQIFSLLDDFRKNGCAILFSSHQLSDVERMADRVAFMRRGELTMMEFSDASPRNKQLEDSLFNYCKGSVQ
ncbi:MAG: ABC transporter ATP-binding protein [Acidobacteriota bacterium]